MDPRGWGGTDGEVKAMPKKRGERMKREPSPFGTLREEALGIGLIIPFSIMLKGVIVIC